MALVAGIVMSLGGAVVVGVLFGRAVSSPADTTSERTIEAPAVAMAGAEAANGNLGRAERKEREQKQDKPAWPADDAQAKARQIAEARSGLVSFAAIGPGDKTLEFEPNRQFFSASATKSMLLVAELRRLRREEAPLDDSTRSLLEGMITLSDNDAADAIYARVGDAGMNEVADAAGMAHFSGDVGHWSNVQITAGDMALFMSKLDELLDLPHGEEASQMLASIHSTQSWGIPQVTPDDARVRFKGGWRPTDTGQLVHQAARVDVGGESYSIAVLTDGNPSMPYGEETIRLLAAALLKGAGTSK